MRLKRLIAYFILGCAFTSCIKDEAPNAEADIVTCTVPGDILKMEPKIDNYRVILMPKEGADLTSVAIEFTLTPGATIDPPSGTPRNFTKDQTYIVTSEDRKWNKTYTVTTSTHALQTRYDFEHSEVYANKYYIFYEMVNGERQDFWASGNSTSTIIFGSKGPDAFPVLPDPNGKSGSCLKLETKTTGSLGAMVGRPLAAGSLFIGEFMSDIAMQKPLEATHYGVPFSRIPVSMTGYYKYKAGSVFTDGKNNVVPDRKDQFNIYAVLFETDNNVKYLDGSNSLTSPNLISIARIEDKKETDEWLAFNIPFVLQPGKRIEPSKLAASKYSIAVVFSSSADGALFNAAVGSTLLIDEVEVHCED